MQHAFDHLARSDGKLKESSFIILLLVFLSLGIYFQVTAFEFIDFDDNLYVYENAQVKSGLTCQSIAWSFSLADKEDTYYHPLTWLSLMLDVQLFGLNAGAQHAVNLLIHTINGILLFLLLNRITSASWLSGLVAALFVAHPVNVESVAWVAERKNVLSTLFWLLTMWMYVRYAQKTNFANYAALVLVFVLGLLAKPMLVTLPFVLLLLDIWPLRRLNLSPTSHSIEPHERSIPIKIKSVKLSRVMLEKAPLLALSVLTVCWVTHSVNGTYKIVSFEAVPLALRLQNFLNSYASYLGQLVWPSNLQFFYVYPPSVPMWQTITAGILIAALSAFAVRRFKSHPYLLVGWLWFLGTLLPVSGIYQAGLWPAMADRWLYVPSIGIFLAFTWGVSAIAMKHHRLRAVWTLGACLWVIGLAWSSHRQTAFWHDSAALFEHAVNSDKSNYVAQSLLGLSLDTMGRREEALSHLQEAVKIHPLYWAGYLNLGNFYYHRGDYPEAQKFYKKALEINPASAFGQNNMANALMVQNKVKEALGHYQAAFLLSPSDKFTRNNIGFALLKIGEVDAAIAQFREATRLDANFETAHVNLGLAYQALGKTDEAKIQFQTALGINPQNKQARDGLASAVNSN
jgi:tetratricopeptide (TPR) repeat protein